jgi:FkbM family methyltransferase
MIVRYLAMHVHAMSSLLDAVTLAAPEGAFPALFNFRAFLRGRRVRVRWNAGAACFEAVEDGVVMAFLNARQAQYAYKRGLAARRKMMEHDYLLASVPLRPGDLVVDCGANVGDLSLVVRARGPGIHYVGVEPSPSEHRCLELNVGAEAARHCGLWNDAGALEFYVSSDGADSSFIEPPTYSHRITVPTVRLDSLGFDRIRLLKLEAEGAEPEVLEGAAGVLARTDFIASDLGFERGLDQQSTFAPVVNAMLRSGFELVDVSHGRIVALFRRVGVT